MSDRDMGKVLKKARKDRRLTQEEVAEKVNITPNYYARIERGEVSPSLETLKDLMKLLKVKTLEISAK